MASNFEISSEVRILWRFYAPLLNAITNPFELATQACSRGILPRDWVRPGGETTVPLLLAVLERVKENSMVFYQFVELLKIYPLLNPLAISMEQSCSKFSALFYINLISGTYRLALFLLFTRKIYVNLHQTSRYCQMNTFSAHQSTRRG